MSLFRKLFGSRVSRPPALPPEGGQEGEPIRAFDKFGRELLIPRREWIGLLRDNLRGAWENPEGLANLIIQALQDGLFTEVESAAQHLHRIDPTPSRGAVLLAIVYLQTDRPAKAERLLESHLAEHGEDGVVLTNLAKAQDALGSHENAMATLWHALELDPNQDNGFGWFESIHREQEGDQGALAACRRVAALPGSWRAQIWLARHELHQRQLDSALDLYRQSLDRAPRPVPTDLLMQLSGDLGQQGHLPQLLEFCAPHFDLDAHGITVGNNLLKAMIDTGQMDSARSLLDQLQAQQRPDWRNHLGFWEDEFQKARLSTEEAPDKETLEITILTLPGALWLPDDHPLAAHFPRKTDDAPHLVLSGCSFEGPRAGDQITMQPSNYPGRYSRALPLFLAEHIALRSPARTTTLIPWALNGAGGFIVSGKAYDDAQIVDFARRSTEQSPHPADFALNCHLVVRGENSTLRLRLLRCIDGRCLTAITRHFPEFAFYRIAPDLLTELGAALVREAEISLASTDPSLAGPELDHYLLRLEQALAVSCSTLEEKNASSLSSPAEILDGMLQLCLQNRGHLPSRMLLLRTMRKLKLLQPALVESMKLKVETLLEDHPLEDELQSLLIQELKEVFET